MNYWRDCLKPVKTLDHRYSIDTNNHHLFGGAYFIDFVGGNYDWPEADWVKREQIFSGSC